MMRDPDTVSITPDGGRMEEAPRWRQDFPIDIPRDEYVARRDFAKFMVLTSFAFAVGQVWIVVQNVFRGRAAAPPVRPVASVAEVPVGGSQLFNYPGDQNHAILVRLAEDRFVA